MMWVAKEPGSSRPGLASDLEEAAAGSHAARSTQVSQRQLLPQERATASARPSKEEPGVTSWVAPLRPRIGSGSEQPLPGTIRGSAQSSPARIPLQRGLLLAQQTATKSHPWLRVAQESSGNARSRRYVVSRNSVLPEGESARDRPPAFPNQDIQRPARLGLRAISQLHPQEARRNADGGQALCQNSDRVRQAP